MTKKMHLIRNITLRVILVCLFLFITISLIAYARGYRLSFESNSMSAGITSTGIISVSAAPNGAKVYVDGKLKGATDLNITLPPGEYTVEVKKEGYTSWTKKVKLKGEIVLTLDALLFPRNPSLLSLTNLGIVQAVPYHAADKIILFSQNDEPEKDGIYIFDAARQALSFLAPLKLIILKSNLPAGTDLAKTAVHFSPDSQQAIFEFPTTSGITYSYLLTLGEEVTQPFDISSSKDTILANWDVQKIKEVTKILETFPKMIRPIAASNFEIISFSPDQTKMLYQAKSSLEIPHMLKSPLIGANQSPETRSIQEGNLYVYDKKEDKNYLIPFNRALAKEPTPSITEGVKTTARYDLTPTPTVAHIYTEKEFPIVWHSDSKHISVQQEREIVMIDYDGDNKRTIYSGPFQQGFFFITNNGKLHILTNLNPQNNVNADLYEIGIQ